MTASNSIWRNFSVMVLALSASSACSQEIQAGAAGALSEAVGDVLLEDTTKMSCHRTRNRCQLTLPVFLIGVGLIGFCLLH